MLVTVCGYEQNPSRSVGGVAHTRLYVRTDREVQILVHTHRNIKLKIRIITFKYTFLYITYIVQRKEIKI